MRTQSLGPSAELPKGPEKNCEGCADTGRVTMRTQPLGLSVEPLWGHATCEGCAEIGRATMRTQPLGSSAELPVGQRSV
eukprot:2743563-Pyramimonas_sp.AAC.1